MMLKQRRFIGGLALLIALAACSDSPVGPADSGTLDTQSVDANLSTFEGFFASPEWKSFEIFGSGIEDSGATGSLIPQLDATPTTARIASDALNRLFLATSVTPIISEGSLGTTFVIDPATGEYAPDPARTGAPANGVRFVLYGVISGSDDPDVGNEIGHIDLVDNGASTDGIDLRLTAVAEGVTFLDYGVSLEGDETAGSVDVDGFLVHEGDRLDFAFAATSADNGGQENISVTASLDVDSHDFHVALDVDGMGEGGEETYTLGLSVSLETQSIAIAATGTDESVSATFRVNGEVFATADGDPDEPTIVGAAGEALSLDEIRVLSKIIEMSEEVLEFFEELLEPAGDIIELGLIL